MARRYTSIFSCKECATALLGFYFGLLAFVIAYKAGDSFFVRRKIRKQLI